MIEEQKSTIVSEYFDVTVHCELECLQEVEKKLVWANKSGFFDSIEGLRKDKSSSKKKRVIQMDETGETTVKYVVEKQPGTKKVS